MTITLKNVDHSSLKTNQIIIIVLSLAAFVFNIPWMAGLVAVVMLVGTLMGKPGFILIYSHILRPLGLVKPKVIPDNPEPHRFSQGLGGVFMLGGSIALFAGSSVLGWGLVWLVTALAALNAFGGVCVGCFIYYWLARIKIPGFYKRPPEGTFPGLRPKELEKNES